ncbi:tRNA dimethylallyltransferase, mitochondrial [Strongyloides ratti]|uniref:tRNA dimethylallyltransferase, mitochondrial n=1 Tax=Strongyloides ratti TaxID=34506 RepID=A0A090MWL1_STRRB|nr:tRNA dimethylallyltransferase, mitochondrial [Strongyloides ratti]CEF63874.1 tRNA dimethylallyltransferase, mitochondrial [Strongyloides ratti]
MKKLENPYVIVMGCTGAGKSDAAIEIAKKFNGEVINADSQQIYKGLDIVTNKVTIDEQKGIKHHLMSFLEPDFREYNVHQFKDDCIEVMNNLWDQGKLPVICGGTNYYIEAVLFKDNLISTDKNNVKTIRQMLKNMSNDELYEMLLETDHISANQIHRNNRQRVHRAIEIALSTGVKKSEFIEKQKEDKNKLRYENVLIFNMDAEKDVLDDRLDKRVIKMEERGLKEELKTFYEKYHEKLGKYGIMQSIGIKEFEQWFKKETDSNFEKGICGLQAHTRKYARKQRRRLEYKLLNNVNDVKNIYLVDTTEINDFYTKNIPIILDTVDNFINNGKILALNNSYCKLWTGNENPQPNYDSNDINKIFFCDVCSLELHGIRSWESHLKGKKHKNFKEKKCRKNIMDNNIEIYKE